MTAVKPPSRNYTDYLHLSQLKQATLAERLHSRFPLVSQVHPISRNRTRVCCLYAHDISFRSFFCGFPSCLLAHYYNLFWPFAFPFDNRPTAFALTFESNQANFISARSTFTTHGLQPLMNLAVVSFTEKTSVILAPHGIAATLSSMSCSEDPDQLDQMLADWHRRFPLPLLDPTNDQSGSTQLSSPQFVEVTVGPTTLTYPSCLVFCEDSTFYQASTLVTTARVAEASLLKQAALSDAFANQQFQYLPPQTNKVESPQTYISTTPMDMNSLAFSPFNPMNPMQLGGPRSATPSSFGLEQQLISVAPLSASQSLSSPLTAVPVQPSASPIVNLEPQSVSMNLLQDAASLSPIIQSPVFDARTASRASSPIKETFFFASAVDSESQSVGQQSYFGNYGYNSSSISGFNWLQPVAPVKVEVQQSKEAAKGKQP